MPQTPNIAFVCTHNACRSQIAEAFAHSILPSDWNIYSAGTTIKDKIDPNVSKLMKQEYSLNVSNQHPKTIAVLPDIDYLVTMGCGVACPSVKAKATFDWGLDDPTGKSDQEYLCVMKIIQEKVYELKSIIEHDIACA